MDKNLLGGSTVLISWADYESGRTTVQLVDAEADTVKREVTLDGVWDTKRQALAHGFALCDRETNRWKLLDDVLTETGSFDAENVDGFFSYDGESYYFLRDGVLHCQNVAGGEAQPVTALSQLRFAELTAYDAASGRMAALFLLSPYGSVCGTAVFDPETGAISLLQEQRYQVMLAPAGGMSLLAFDNDKMGYSALCGSGDTFWFADASLFLDAGGALYAVGDAEELIGVGTGRTTLYNVGESITACDLTANGIAGEMYDCCVLPEAGLLVGGMYENGETLTVEFSAAPGARIFYTLDCSAPDETDAPYTGPIAVTGTTVVRAVAYQEGYLPSYSASQSYLYDAEHTMRVVSMVADPEDIFGSEGFHTLYERDLERPGHIEVYTENGAQMLSENCALRLHGQGSRKYQQKGFKVIARREYGTNRFRAPLFSGRDYTEYQSFLLRASSEDGRLTRMRDSILTALARGTDVLYQETELCVLYINGEYWGHYNMRERICAAMICQYEGWEGQEDSIDIVKGNDLVLRGSDDSFQAMLAYLREHGVPDDETLARVGEEVDLDSFIAYQALQIFVGNADTLNVKRYRNRNADGKWHWAIFDLDWGFYVDTNSIRRWLDPQGMGTSLATDNTLFIALMGNPTFYDRFLTYMGDMLSTQWTSLRIVEMIRERYLALTPELPRHQARWGQSRENFEERVAELVEYAKTRPRKLVGYFRDTLGLTGEEMEHYFGAAMRRIEEEEAAWA